MTWQQIISKIMSYIKEEGEVKREELSMTITPAVWVVDQKLVVKGRTILENVPENVRASSGSNTGPAGGMFLGTALEKDSSWHVVSLGTLRGVRFMACFWFKLWWMAQKMGDQGRDIPRETQFLLLETTDGSHLTSDGGNGEHQIVYTVFLPLIEGPFRACLQGSPEDKLELSLESGDEEMTASTFTRSLFISAGTDPFGTITDAIRERHEKKLPGIVDYFGWCMWDAFYQDVTQEAVKAGLDTLATSGTPPMFMIIDDGWQSVGGDSQQKDETKELEAQPQPQLIRLTGVKENSKFQNKDDQTVGIKSIVNIAKEKYGLKYVYLSLSDQPSFTVNSSFLLYSQPEMFCSIALFCNSSKQTALVRASDDFFPRDPMSHTIHIAALAYNNVFLGEFMQPDWDMFHSLHPAAEYHASAPAISGGPVYVSLLKIWNIKKYTGVLGVYNCQGAAWSSIERKNTFHETGSTP
ncbi:hypothetical protein RJ639_032038 [Escallonia herrerae]|uniref:galactinol--sucrose galactosyltransferase n=1 Tax=Escallonia herrerae TaxID=1293975 RepID=A0AA88X3Q8_9ASTE|nr:hypothetical protein RJ639_032038 [Escallonia herrerae]